MIRPKCYVISELLNKTADKFGCVINHRDDAGVVQPRRANYAQNSNYTACFVPERRYNKRRIAQWDREERLHDELLRASHVVAPPYVAWPPPPGDPGEDPLAEVPEDEDPTREPKLPN